MPIKSHGSVPNPPQGKREHKSVQRCETVVKALEATGNLEAALKDGGKK